MPAFSTTALLLGAAGAGTALGLRKRKARKARESALFNPDAVIGPAPLPPTSALAVQSAARAQSATRMDAARRRGASPFGVLTGPGPRGAQSQIRVAPPPSGLFRPTGR
jgi:hypothetical protein